MKKFICTIPLQVNNRELEKVVYEAIDNKRLVYEEAVSFPIIPVINGYVKDGEKIALLVLKQKAEGTDSNFEAFQEQVAEVCDKKDIAFEIKVIDIIFDETSGTHLKTFLSLIEHIQPKDDLYACMTYGTKPIPIVEIMALNYASRNVRQVHVGCIVYGQKSWERNTNVIYDITSLFVMDEVVHEIASMKMKNPLQYIRDIMNYTEDEEE